MDKIEIIVEEIKRVNTTLDKHSDKFEQLLLMPLKCEKRFIKRPSLISVSLLVGIFGTIASIAIASISR